jgi:hypothetical protein
MSNHDQTVKQANSFEGVYKMRPTPSYLITLDTPSKKNEPNFFIAFKLDDGPQYVKCAGFFTSATREHIAKNYEELIKNVPTENVVELMIPWHQTKHIQSLIYRYRTK